MRFPSKTNRKVRPDHFSVMAMLNGFSAPSNQQCRVLELACGIGINLTAMAQALPQGQFTGIDLSQSAIDEGQALIQAAGLNNISLQQGDITELSGLEASYDFIIIGGTFSWVSARLQAQVLSLIKEHLAPDGVAYIHYLTKPGWCVRGMLRDLLLMQIEPSADPKQQVVQARQGLADIIKTFPANPEQNSYYTHYLRQEFKGIAAMSDGEFFHEYLEDEVLPYYFHEFHSLAQSHGLQHMVDANQRHVSMFELTPEMHSHLDKISDAGQREQQSDLLLNRKVRESLLCHKDHQQNHHRGGTPAAELFYIASPLRPSVRIDPKTREQVRFSTSTEKSVVFSAPLVKAALMILADNWPIPISFSDLLETACGQLGLQTNSSHSAELWGVFVKGYKVEAIELTVYPPMMTLTPGEFPTASPLARQQAINDSSVTNLRHGHVMLDEDERSLLTLLDGSHSNEDLAGLAKVENYEEVLERLIRKALLMATP